MWEAKDPRYKTYEPLLQKLEQPFVLYLALLLHDTGKPEGHGKHSEVSATLANRVAKRLHLDGATSHTLRLVIEKHLLMAIVSQRPQLDDSFFIRSFRNDAISMSRSSFASWANRCKPRELFRCCLY